MQRRSLVGDEFDYGGRLVELRRLLLRLAATAAVSKGESEKAAGWLHHIMSTKKRGGAGRW
jgi:hypothetical protein